MSKPAFSVLNTRPMPMAEELQQALHTHHINSIKCPVIENIAINPGQIDLVEQLSDPNLDWIFISRSSVQFLLLYLEQIDLPTFNPAGQVFAVGASTKTELQNHNAKLAVITPKYSDSEGLLALPELNNSNAVMLVKGVGGRGLIAQQLTANNKPVHELNLYQRQALTYEPSDLVSWHQCQLILATSVDIAKAVLNNINQLPSAQTRQEFLQNKNYLVLSERIKQFLIKHSVAENNIIVCPASDNFSIIDSIKQIAKRELG